MEKRKDNRCEEGVHWTLEDDVEAAELKEEPNAAENDEHEAAELRGEPIFTR